MAEVSKDFLCRGVQLYRDALRTIRYFEKSVQAISAEILKQHLAELSGVLGVELLPSKIEPYTGEWVPGAWVGAIIGCPNPPLSKILVGVLWEITADGSDQTFAAVNLECWSIQFKERLHNLLKSSESGVQNKIQEWKYELWTQAELRPDDALDLRRLLDEQLLEWTARLRKIGGIRGLEAG